MVQTPFAHHAFLLHSLPSPHSRVFSGFDKVNNHKVAIKKLLLQGDCQLPPTVTREIKILKQMKHPNIVKLIDVVTSKCSRWECTCCYPW